MNGDNFITKPALDMEGLYVENFPSTIEGSYFDVPITRNDKRQCQVIEGA